VKIVLPNSIISCIVFEIGMHNHAADGGGLFTQASNVLIFVLIVYSGTGRSKHIEVTVNGVSNANTDDVNFAFSRSGMCTNISGDFSFTH
jgi:hypothetical protein